MSDVLEKNVFGTEVVTVAPNLDHDYTSTDNLMTVNEDLCVNNVHNIEISASNLQDNIAESVHEEINEVETDMVCTDANVENVTQDNDTSAEILLEQDLFEGADEANTVYLPFTISDIECINNDTFLGTINVVGSEFTISDENDMGVEVNDVFLEQIDQLDLETDTCDLVHNLQPENDLVPTSSNLTKHINGEEQGIIIEEQNNINENSLNITPDANVEEKINEENANRNALNANEDENIENQFNEESDSENEQNDQDNKKRKRNKKSVPESWEKNKIKKARMTGQSYIGYSRKKTPDDKYVVQTGCERKGRKMGPECTSKTCKTSKIKKCRFFTLAQREQLFKNFWNLSWDEKAMMVYGLVSLSIPKQKTLKKKGSKSRKTSTFTYHLHLNNDRVKVCKPFFLSTLGVNEWMVQNWVKKNSDEIGNEDEDRNEDEDNPVVPPAKKKRKSSKGKPDERMDRLKKFFDDLPKVPSHYCRRSTQKLYLETNVESKANLYRLYTDKMKVESLPFYSEFVFYQEFENLNLAIFQPRKDRCDICYGYESKNVDKDVWEKHIQEKDRARMEKETDKEKASRMEIYCLTMDLQAVKCVPNIKASESYYKTKLACHNFTMYNLANNQCTNYWWNESEGDLCASVFATYITDYLSSHCLEPKLPIVIFSDGCGYQNRNATLSNALLRFAKDNNVEVTQKYLCKGHTQMECDSVHATIEKKLKGKDIFVPFQYVQLTQSARQKPEPYEVKYITHSFFSDYTVLNKIKSIRPGQEPSDPKVIDLRALKYTPEEVLYQLDFDSDFAKLPEREKRTPRGKKRTGNPEHEGSLPKLFKNRLPIKLRKWNDLQDLKGVIPTDYHAFYDSLPKCSAQPPEQKKKTSKND